MHRPRSSDSRGGALVHVEVGALWRKTARYPSARCRSADGRPIGQTPARRGLLRRPMFSTAPWSSPISRALDRYVRLRAGDMEPIRSLHEIDGFNVRRAMWRALREHVEVEWKRQVLDSSSRKWAELVAGRVGRSRSMNCACLPDAVAEPLEPGPRVAAAEPKSRRMRVRHRSIPR